MKKKKFPIQTILIFSSLIIGFLIIFMPMLTCFSEASNVGAETGSGVCAFIPIIFILPGILFTLASLFTVHAIFTKKSGIYKGVFFFLALVLLYYAIKTLTASIAYLS